ncbi:zinc finger protein with KRAB and SCAN domains 1-like isoform X2 [Ambystoma mexicanum]|uniref:zinc finger protein with KRAB and SCAN domains 1-like isoform X2 n=1 Tax=Ambystoma mexicanum TaxID=8296 RepID=UPI0037E94384
MGRRKVQCTTEFMEATSFACRISSVRDTPEIPFLPEDSERLGAEVLGGAVCEEGGMLPMSDNITEDSSQNPHRFLATLQQLQLKMDHLQNTMEGIPAKVAKIMDQLWLTKGQDYLKRHVMPAEMVRPATGRDCDLYGFPPLPLPVNPGITDGQSQWNKSIQPVITDGQRQWNKSLQPVITDGQRQWNKSLQPVITDGLCQENQCIQPVFEDWHCHQQSQAIQPTSIDGQSPEEIQCTRPVTNGQDTVQRLKLETLCPGEKGQEENGGLQQVFHCRPGAYQLDSSCFYGLDSSTPTIFPGSDTLSEDDTVLMYSLARKNTDPEMTRFKATHGPVCGRTAFIERIKGTPQDFQSSRERERLNREAELSVGSSIDMQFKQSASEWEEEVFIKEEEGTCNQAVPGSFDEEAMQCNVPLKVRRVNPSLTSPQSHHKSSVKTSCRDHPGSEEEDGRTREDVESSGKGVQEKESFIINHQEEAKEYSKEKAPLSGDHKDDKARDCMRDERAESPFAENGSVIKTENLKLTLQRWTIQRDPTGDGQGPPHKLMKESTDSQKPPMSSTCTECGESFTQPSQLYLHQKFHRRARPHQCKECGLYFTWRSLLHIHQRSHTGERPYQCAHCEKRFSQIGNLQNHQMIHSGEKPFECTECGKRFNQMSNLKIHQRIHSGEKPYECTECGKHFIRTSHLQRHQKVHSGKKQ